MRFPVLIPLLLVPLVASCSPKAEEVLSENVVITAPSANEKVTSPLVVKGSARGTWYFEASFPVELTDASGNLIAIEPAQAKGEWMTTDFVEFEATLPFTTDAASGFLVFRKDNPSGLPEYDDEVRIPIRF